MDTFGYILLALGVAIAVVLFLASRQPDTFRIERKAVINTPMSTVFAQIDDLVAWQAWSPWAKKDPNAKATFGAITAGKGANFGWDGNRNVGKGQMTITESVPHERVVLRLDFVAPFKATNTAEFTLRSAGSGTEVTWAMFGHSNLMSKVMCGLFMDMDKMIGKDFETGLANMKAISESRA